MQWKYQTSERVGLSAMVWEDEEGRQWAWRFPHSPRSLLGKSGRPIWEPSLDECYGLGLAVSGIWASGRWPSEGMVPKISGSRELSSKPTFSSRGERPALMSSCCTRNKLNRTGATEAKERENNYQKVGDHIYIYIFPIVLWKQQKESKSHEAIKTVSTCLPGWKYRTVRLAWTWTIKHAEVTPRTESL